MNLENVVKSNYDLNIISIKKNKDSTDGNVYNADTSDNKYIIKIYDDIEKANNMVLLYNYLDNMYVPKIVKNNVGNSLTKYRGKYIVMYTFLEGKPISMLINENKGFCLERDIWLIAKEVRKFHDLTLGKSFELNKIGFANNLNRKSILHFDLTKENIFINNGKIGFIDFDDAKYGDSVCDITILLSCLFISRKRDIDNRSINLFLDSYYKDNEQELRKIEQNYIKFYTKKWVEYILNEHEFGIGLENSFNFKKKSVNYIKFFNKEVD